MTPVPLALFARPPVAGHTKTRLIPALGPDGAARLYEAFLADTIATVRGVDGVSPQLWWSNPPAHPDAVGMPERLQEGPDLGARLTGCLVALIQEAGVGMALGTDAPTLPGALLHAAKRALAVADVVLGPSSDGGYYLVGLRTEPGTLFDGVRWSTRHAFEDTAGRAHRLGRSVFVLPPWYDVDRAASLRLLRTHLLVDPDAAPATARVLRTARTQPGRGRWPPESLAD